MWRPAMGRPLEFRVGMIVHRRVVRMRVPGRARHPFLVGVRVRMPVLVRMAVTVPMWMRVYRGSMTMLVVMNVLMFMRVGMAMLVLVHGVVTFHVVGVLVAEALAVWHWSVPPGSDGRTCDGAGG